MGGKNNLCVSRMVNGLQRTSQVSDSAVVVDPLLGGGRGVGRKPLY